MNDMMNFSKAVTGMDRSGSFRVYMGITTATVQEAHMLHRTSPLATHVLGRALTGAGLFGLMLREPGFKCTLQFKGDGPAQQVLCTADSAGHVKGYIVNPQIDLPPKEDGSPDVGGALGQGILTCIRDTGTAEPYVGKVDLVSGEIAEDLTYYFLASEQQKTLVSLGVKLNETGETAGAGGMIIQVLPDALDEAISALEAWLPVIPSLSALAAELSEDAKEADNPDRDIIPDLMREFMHRAFSGMPEEYAVEPMDVLPLEWNCDCSEERLEDVLISLGSKELSAIIDEDGEAEVTCQFCGKSYHFDKPHLEKLRMQCIARKLN